MLFETIQGAQTTVKLNYNSNVDFYIGRIIEYDIKSAYYSILRVARDNNVSPISEEEFLHLDSIKDDKQERLIFVGNLMNKYLELSDFLHNSLRYILTTFFITNNLQESDVISVKKDAIFVTKICENLVIDGVELTEKHMYKVYFAYKILVGKYKGFIEYYIKSDEVFDIKGLPKELLNNNKPFFNQVVKSMFSTALMNDRESILLRLESMYKDFSHIPTYDEKKRLKLKNGFSLNISYEDIQNSCLDRDLLYNIKYYNLFFKPYINKLLQLNL